MMDSLQQHFALNPQQSKILVVGLGITGISVARFLVAHGFQFAMIDSRNDPPLDKEFFQENPDIAVFTGGFDEAAFKVATH